ncbi:hypothetical protein BBJ28_00017513 [Nothophytophthora sp. Chile5]|nr:hypothetical protein BBJ28_00017513 [Nothophytophthora sp. Chile5]
MLMPRRRCVAYVARALRRPAAAPAVAAPWRVRHPLLQQGFASFAPPSGIGSRSKPKRSKSPSFAIAAAFEGHEDLEDDEDEDHLNDGAFGGEAELDDEDEHARALTQQFRRGMEKKKLWMQSLAAQKSYSAVVKSVADCYAPLYAAMGLEGQCPLLEVARKEAHGDDELETQFQPARFDDMLAKTTEQEALALLVISKHHELAIAIVEHREKLSEELAQRAQDGAGVVLAGQDEAEDEQAVTLSHHFRMFYSWAMSAYALAGSSFHPKLFATYKRAEEDGVYPTANMNVKYLHALVSERRHEDVLEFYEVVRQKELAATIFFYRQLLFAVSASRNTDALQQVVEEMRLKGFKLRANDYSRAIRAYDDVYFLSKERSPRQPQHSAKDSAGKFTTPTDNYIACLARIRQQEKHPEKFERQMNAVHSVLELFDEMVDIDGLIPRDDQMFPRVITAAVIAQECERVPELLALHAEHVKDGTPLHYAGLRMAVNALLLLDKPTEAWGLVRETYPELKPWQYTHVANILDYLSAKNRGADIVTLLHDTEELGLQGVFTNGVVKIVLPALCRSIDSVSDEELWTALAQHEDVFAVRSNVHQLELLLRECCRSRRLGVVKTALRAWMAVPGNKRPLKARLAVLLVKTFETPAEGEVDWEFMTELFEAIDLVSVRHAEDREALVAATSRAYEAIGKPEGAERVRFIAEKTAKRSRPRASSSKKSNLLKADTGAQTLLVHGIPVASSSS